MVRRFKTRKLKKRGGGIFGFGAGDAAPAPANTDAALAPDADKAAPASVSWFTGIQKKLGFNKPECPECPKCAEERGQSDNLTDPSLAVVNEQPSSGDTTSSEMTQPSDKFSGDISSSSDDILSSGDITSSSSSGDPPSSPSSGDPPSSPSSGDIPSSPSSDYNPPDTNPQDGGRRRRTQKKYKGKRRHSRKQLKRRKNSRRSRK